MGVNLAGGAGMVNAGTIVGGAGGGGGGDHYYGTGFGQGGPGGAGVALLAPATIVNDGLIVDGAGGQLYGPGGSGGAGVYIRSTQADLINLGSIIGGIGGSGYRGTYRYRAGIEGDGVSVILSGASIVNGDAGVHTALISGYIGVATANPVDVTVINYGTIEGGESSVELGSTSDRLIAEAGSTLVGTAFGAGGNAGARRRRRDHQRLRLHGNLIRVCSHDLHRLWRLPDRRGRRLDAVGIEYFE